MKTKKLYQLGIENEFNQYSFTSKFSERSRDAKYENIGCLMTRDIKPTHDIDDADIIWFRHKPENITDVNYPEWKTILDNNSDKIILNHVEHFMNYDSKDRCYDLWKQNGLNVPDCIVVNELSDIVNMIKKHGKICLRTNNEAGGLYLHFVDDKTDKQEISNLYDELCAARDRQINGTDHREHLGGNARDARPDTKVIAVEFLKNPDIKSLYRVIVVGEKVIGGYALTSKEDSIHWRDQKFETIDEFIKSNIHFKELCEDDNFCKDMVKAVSCLNQNLGSVEFMIHDNKIYLIEFNSIWAGTGAFNYKDSKMKDYLINNIDEFREKMWPVYDWNQFVFYKKFYEAFSQFG